MSWEDLGLNTARMEVPGGWLYRYMKPGSSRAAPTMAFVPSPSPGKGSISQCIDIVFAGEGPHQEFVEVHDMNGKSIEVGRWVEMEGEYGALRICARDLHL